MPASVDAEVKQTLAPTGKLRVGVYAGSPTSMIVDPKSGEKIGIALDLGRELARDIGVPRSTNERSGVIWRRETYDI